MSPNKIQAQFNARLLQQGFDVAAPSIDLAWSEFKAFMQMPLSGWKTTFAYIEVGHAWDRDDVLWLEFRRQIEDEEGEGAAIGCLFSREVPPELEQASKSFWWWPQHGDLTTYFAEVEAMAEFKACVALGGWGWEE